MQKDTLDPDGVMPIAENIYVQPGLAEGMTNAARCDRDETVIMQTLSANNALARGNYQAAEHLLGRDATVEETQNGTTVPNKRVSQHGGPDVHIGAMSRDIGTNVRNGPNYQSVHHMLSQLGEQIDVLAEQHNIPKEAVIALKSRYNLISPTNPSAAPNTPAGWKSVFEMIRREIETARTGNHNLRPNFDGADNAHRQAAGNPGHNPGGPGPGGRPPYQNPPPQNPAYQNVYPNINEPLPPINPPPLEQGTDELMRTRHFTVRGNTPPAPIPPIVPPPDVANDRYYDMRWDGNRYVRRNTIVPAMEDIDDEDQVSPVGFQYTQNKMTEADEVKAQPPSQGIGGEGAQNMQQTLAAPDEQDLSAIALGTNNPIIDEHLVNAFNLTNQNRPDAQLQARQAMIESINGDFYDNARNRRRLALLRDDHPPRYDPYSYVNRERIPWREEQLQLPVSRSVRQVPLEEKSNWVLRAGEVSNPDLSHDSRQLDANERAELALNWHYLDRGLKPPASLPTSIRSNFNDPSVQGIYQDQGAPLTAQLLGKTGRDAVPISAQIQTPLNRQLFEPNLNQVIRQPLSIAGEQLRAELLPTYAEYEQSLPDYNEEDEKRVTGWNHIRVLPDETDDDREFAQWFGGKVSFGKHLIDKDKLLHEGVVSLSTRTGRKVSRMKNIHLVKGSGLHNALLATINGKKPNMKKMTEEEKSRMGEIFKRSRVNYTPIIGSAINVNPLSELQIAMGEIDAGNDNPKIRTQIRRLLPQIPVGTGRGEMTKADISSIRQLYLSS
jgi:hypothetical protein